MAAKLKYKRTSVTSTLYTFHIVTYLYVEERKYSMFPTKNNMLKGERMSVDMVPDHYLIVATFLTPFYSRCTLPLSSHNFSD